MNKSEHPSEDVTPCRRHQFPVRNVAGILLRKIGVRFHQWLQISSPLLLQGDGIEHCRLLMLCRYVFRSDSFNRSESKQVPMIQTPFGGVVRSKLGPRTKSCFYRWSTNNSRAKLRIEEINRQILNSWLSDSNLWARRPWNYMVNTKLQSAGLLCSDHTNYEPRYHHNLPARIDGARIV